MLVHEIATGASGSASPAIGHIAGGAPTWSEARQLAFDSASRSRP